MENATKALTMAAGVLIAIMVTALIYILINQIAQTSEQRELRLKAQQIEKFNKEYESYEKKLLRGTEIITVMNKAISNNKKNSEQDKIYDIDVRFILDSAIESIEITYKEGNGKEEIGKEIKRKTETILSQGVVYSLIDEKEDDRINKKISNFLQLGAIKTSDDGASAPIYDESTRTYTVTYNSFQTFKRKIFKCTKLEYSSNTGRINLIEFTEQVLSTEMKNDW